MKKCTMVILILIAVVAMSGCSGGGGAIGKVKSGTLDIDNTTTVGKVLDNYPYLTNKGWDSFEDQQGRRVVEWQGDIDPDYLRERFSAPYIIIKEPIPPCSFKVQFILTNDGEGFVLGAAGYSSGESTREADSEYLISVLYQGEKIAVGDCEHLWPKGTLTVKPAKDIPCDPNVYNCD